MAIFFQKPVDSLRFETLNSRTALKCQKRKFTKQITHLKSYCVRVVSSINISEYTNLNPTQLVDTRNRVCALQRILELMQFYLKTTFRSIENMIDIIIRLTKY